MKNTVNNAYTSAIVNEEGTITIPAFIARGYGYLPGDEVPLVLPTDCCTQNCEESGLLIKQICGDCDSDGYTTDGDDINIPLWMLGETGIPVGSEISVLRSDGMLIIAAISGGHQRDLTDELGCFMTEIGHDPEIVETIEAALPF